MHSNLFIVKERLFGVIVTFSMSLSLLKTPIITIPLNIIARPMPWRALIFSLKNMNDTTMIITALDNSKADVIPSLKFAC